MKELYIAKLKEISLSGIKDTYTIQERRNLKNPNLIHNFSNIDELVEATIYLGREKDITFNFDIPNIQFSTRDKTGLDRDYQPFSRISLFLEPLSYGEKKEYVSIYHREIMKIIKKSRNEYFDF